MTTQNNSNELRVERDADIEEDLKEFGIVDAAVATFTADNSRSLDNQANSTGNNSEGAVSGVKVDFVDGKATSTRILVPITQTMSTPAPDLDDKKKSKIKEKADKSKEAKEREGFGE